MAWLEKTIDGKRIREMLIESKASNDHMPTSQTNPPENQGNQTEIKPSQTEKPEPCTSRGDEALTKVGRDTPCPPSSPPPTSEDVTSDSQSKNNGPNASPSPGGDLSRLGNGERNLSRESGTKVAEQPSERARASQRRDEGELTTNSQPSVSPEGCGTLAGDNIPGKQPSITPHPERVLENIPTTTTATSIRPISPIRPIASSTNKSEAVPDALRLAPHASPWDSFSEPCGPRAPRPQPQPPYVNPLKYYGPCPPPETPGSRWKVRLT